MMNERTDLPRLLGVPEVAEILGVTTRTVWAMIADNQIDSLKIRGRRKFTQAAVAKVISDGGQHQQAHAS